MSIKTIFALCLIAVFVYGFIAGVLVGEYLEMRYINDMMNTSAHTNNLIRDNDKFYLIYPYNVSGFNMSDEAFIRNLTLER